MQNIIRLEDNAQIAIEHLNYVLQYRRKSKGLKTWRTVGYFPDLVSLATEYLNSAPTRSDNAITTIQELFQVIKKAEDNICNLINNNKQTI